MAGEKTAQEDRTLITEVFVNNANGFGPYSLCDGKDLKGFCL